MAFDGSGIFLRLRSWIADATAGVKIRADFHDDEDNNFADGLSQCIVKDGQTTITQNIPFNSKRVTALSDPVDPQDAATKAYADTKMPLDGSVPITGDVIIRNDDPSFTLDGKPGFKNSIYGDKNGKHRWEIVLGNASAEAGSNAGSDFNLLHYADDGTLLGDALPGIRSTGLLSVKGNPTAALGIVTKQYADTAAANATAVANTKLPIAGGTVTGELTVGTGYLRFTTPGGPGYIQWNGSGNYALGGGGTIWHSGNFTPGAAGTVSNGRLALAADQYSVNAFGITEPYDGAVMTGFGWVATATFARFRYMQLYTTGWFTCGYTA